MPWNLIDYDNNDDEKNVTLIYWKQNSGMYTLKAIYYSLH